MLNSRGIKFANIGKNKILSNKSEFTVNILIYSPLSFNTKTVNKRFGINLPHKIILFHQYSPVGVN